MRDLLLPAGGKETISEYSEVMSAAPHVQAFRAHVGSFYVRMLTSGVSRGKISYGSLLSDWAAESALIPDLFIGEVLFIEIDTFSQEGYLL